MPAQVVVVKRSRRRAFAILRAVPAWLRAVLSTLRIRTAAHPIFDLARFDAYRDSGLLAPERRSGVARPRLRADASVNGCSTCLRCVGICPSDALDLATPAHPGTDPPLRFELDPGRCIGCAECVRVCPSSLLEMRVALPRVGGGGAPGRVDLLGDLCAVAGN